MKKRFNIGLIVLLIGIFLSRNLTYSLPDSSILRPASVFNFQDYKSNKSERSTNLGSATIVFRIMNCILREYARLKEDFNIMITYKCSFACEPCFARDAKIAGQNRDADKEILYSIFDQFEGFRKIHIVGTGEPLAYGKERLLEGGVSQDFLDIVHYAAKRIEEVRIVTNAYLVPENVQEAESFFAQFPKNVVWLVSVDKYHEKQMKDRTGKSLSRIINTMEKLAGKGIIKTAYNIRIESRSNTNVVYFGLTGKLAEDPDNVFINTFIAQGGAKDHNLRASLLDPNDIETHARDPRKLFPFIDPDGNIVPSDHIAYMTHEQRMDYEHSVLGNIADNSIANILLKELLFKKVYLHFLRLPYQMVQEKILKDPEGNVKGGATLIYPLEDVLQSVVRAIVLYSTGDTPKARSLLRTLDIKNRYVKDAIVNLSYFLFLNVDDIDMKSFILDCIGDEIFHHSPDDVIPDIETAFGKKASYTLEDFRPDIKTALEILSAGKKSRRDFETRIDWFGMPKWKRNPNMHSNIHCPVYEIDYVAGTYTTYVAPPEDKILLWNGETFFILTLLKDPTDTATKFFDSFAAKAKSDLCPLGILQEKSRGCNTYYIDGGEKEINTLEDLVTLYGRFFL